MSLDLSEAFDRADWKSLWEALRLHGASPHLIWLPQMTFANQKGQVVSNTGTNHEFDICAGVRQGCVLSPRLFCSVLQLAMDRWRNQVEHFCLNLEDGMSHLLDLRCSDDISLFRESAQAVGNMLDTLVTCLGQVGLKLNASKTKVLTTQTQPPSTLTTPAGLELEVLERTKSHKWLGCFSSMINMGNRQQDMNYTIVYKTHLEHFKLRGRGVPLERAAARVCREAGARVTTNTRLSDLNLEHIARHDDRRIEVIANGLPLWGGGTTCCRHHLGISSDLLQSTPPTCRPIHRSSTPGRTQIEGKDILVVLALEIGGRWSQEATTFLRLLAHTKARAAPDILRQAVEASLLSRWSAIPTHAAQHAFAASLLDLDCAGTSTVDGDGPSTSQLLSEAPVQPPHTSRVPARP